MQRKIRSILILNGINSVIHLKKGNREIVELLVKRRANINSRTPNGWTPGDYRITYRQH